MPELDFDLKKYQERRLEIRDPNDFTVWQKAKLEKILPDSTVALRFDDEPNNPCR